MVRFEYSNKIKYQYRWNNYNSESEICVPAPYLWTQTIASSLQLQCNTQTIVWKSSLLPRHGFQRHGSSEHLRSSKEPAKCRSNNPRRCQTKAETARALMISWNHVAGLVLLLLNFLRRNIFPQQKWRSIYDSTCSRFFYDLLLSDNLFVISNYHENNVRFPKKLIEASYLNLCELYQTKSYNYDHDHFITNIFVNVKNNWIFTRFYFLVLHT